MKKGKLRKAGIGTYIFTCPGCYEEHQIWSGEPTRNISWDFNGDFYKPTFNPSLKISFPRVNDKGEKVTDICHSFIKDGKIQYLKDCTHKLAGQTVELPSYTKE